jgi:hypothetical protein
MTKNPAKNLKKVNSIAGIFELLIINLTKIVVKEKNRAENNSNKNPICIYLELLEYNFCQDKLFVEIFNK